MKIHHFECGGLYLPQLLELIIVPSVVRCAADIHIASDVGEDQSIFFHSGEDHPYMCREAADIIVCLQPEAGSKWQGVGVRACAIAFVPCG